MAPCHLLDWPWVVALQKCPPSAIAWSVRGHDVASHSGPLLAPQAQQAHLEAQRAALEAARGELGASQSRVTLIEAELQVRCICGGPARAKVVWCGQREVQIGGSPFGRCSACCNVSGGHVMWVVDWKAKCPFPCSPPAATSAARPRSWSRRGTTWRWRGTAWSDAPVIRTCSLQARAAATGHLSSPVPCSSDPALLTCTLASLNFASPDTLADALTASSSSRTPHPFALPASHAFLQCVHERLDSALLWRPVFGCCQQSWWTLGRLACVSRSSRRYPA